MGGKRKILMADLRQSFQNLSFSDITTYIQTGNVIFHSKNKEDGIVISNKIKQMISLDYGFDVPVLIRTVDEIEEIIHNNPFLEESNMKIENLHVTFLKDVPNEDDVGRMKLLDFSPDRFKIINNNVFIHCTRKYHETKLGNNLFEKKLKVSASTRTWKTILKLSELSKS